MCPCLMNIYRISLSDYLGKIKRYIMGDFNINLFNSDSHVPTSEFISLCLTHSMLPLINRPTRVAKSSATLIDNIFTNNIEATKFQGIFYTDISDHFPIFMIENSIKHDIKKMTGL